MRAFDETDIPARTHATEALAPWADAFAGAAPAGESFLTSRDYTLLEGHLYRRGEDGPQPLLARLIRAKLSHARVVLTGDVDADVATGDSRVVIAVDGRPDESRLLVHWDDDRVRGDTLRVATLLGVTVLGMRAGQEARLLRADGSLGRVLLRQVAFQPEAFRNRAIRNAR